MHCKAPQAIDNNRYRNILSSSLFLLLLLLLLNLGENRQDLQPAVCFPAPYG